MDLRPSYARNTGQHKITYIPLFKKNHRFSRFDHVNIYRKSCSIWIFKRFYLVIWLNWCLYQFYEKSKKSIFQKISKINFGGPPTPQLIPPLPPILYTILYSFISIFIGFYRKSYIWWWWWWWWWWSWSFDPGR